MGTYKRSEEDLCFFGGIYSVTLNEIWGVKLGEFIGLLRRLKTLNCIDKISCQ